MDGSLDAFSAALTTFADRLGDTRLWPLLIALLLHTASLAVRAAVWRNILRCAFPGRTITGSSAFWAYLAGTGANAVTPFRGGDVVRVQAARRIIPGASVATIISTLVAETGFGVIVILGLAVWAVSSGGLPPLVRVPDARAFEFSLYASHPWATLFLVLGIVALGAVVLRLTAGHVRGLSRRVAAGFQVVHTPARFLREVVAPQSVDWVLRAATAYAFLVAFHVHASVRTAVLVLIVQSVATAIPFTPAGSGAQQALLAFVLGGAASQAHILAFSVGQQVVVTAINVLFGLVALLKVFGHVRRRRLLLEPEPV